MNAEPAGIHLEARGGGWLAFTGPDGVCHDPVRPLRLFPLTDPAHWVALCAADGRELWCFENPDDLPAELAAVLRAVLAERDFVPVVQKIHSIRRAAQGHEWHVTTDRGMVRFLVESDESIQPLGGGRLVIQDSRNTRYLVPSKAALDRRSRHRLERYF